jgi:hypothetical protein
MREVRRGGEWRRVRHVRKDEQWRPTNLQTSATRTHTLRAGGTAYLLKRVGTRYENRLSVGGFKGKAR